MVVMFDVTDPVEREHAMAKHEATPAQLDWKAVLTGDENGFRALLQTVVQEVLEAEMTEALQAEKNERTASRLGHRSGYYERKLVTRIGVLELRVPQDRAGRFSTELFERYQRSEKALVAALAEMYVQGVSTRKSLPSRRRGSRRSPRTYAATASRPRRSAMRRPGSTGR
jgi:transposase-like protein